MAKGLSWTKAGSYSGGVLTLNTPVWDSVVHDGSLIPHNSILFFETGQHNAAFSVGKHTGPDASASLIDTNRSWSTNEWNGYRAINVSKGIGGDITANTATEITATMPNTWDIDNFYAIQSNTILTDTTKTWMVNQWVDFLLINKSDGCTGVITANTANTITVASMTGGYKNGWRLGNEYAIVINIDNNDIIEYQNITRQGGFVTLNAKGVPTVQGPNYGHSIVARIVDVSEEPDVTSPEFVTELIV